MIDLHLLKALQKNKKYQTWVPIYLEYIATYWYVMAAKTVYTLYILASVYCLATPNVSQHRFISKVKLTCLTMV